MNLDYESQLFEGRSSEKMNQALEYLAFYLEEGPFSSEAIYSKDFLENVERLSGHRPLIERSRNFRNIWGALCDREVERELNSKILSAKLTEEISAAEGVVRVLAKDDLPSGMRLPAIVKLPHSMSGRGVRKILDPKDLDSIPYPFVLEPFLERKKDFSHFIFPGGEMITYENIVDEKFQYRGTIFHHLDSPVLSSIPWSNDVSSDEKQRYLTELSTYRSKYEQLTATAPMNLGYSIDSFAYEEMGELKIRTCSEFNFRRTMGWLTFELSKKLARDFQWVALRVFFLRGDPGPFRKFMSAVGLEDKILLLSPVESRAQVLFLRTNDPREGEKLLAHADGFDVHKFPDPKL